MGAPAATDRTNGNHALWGFTPSRTDPKDLEFILVQRHQLLQDAVERVRESALTGHKHHLLFVGPRGCGKTHLITLIVSRLCEAADLANRLRIAWLHEDETCTTVLELLLKIHAALEKSYPDEYRGTALGKAYDLDAGAALGFVSEHLLAALGDRTLLVAAENLDAIFENLGGGGQKQLRAFIQEHPKLTIVATAQRLVEDLSDRASPFFGFFQTEHLKPLNVDEATQLLQNIAKLHEKDDVVRFLSTPRGRSRVRALHHLSGGNHRIYIVLSQFITRDSIDALVSPFMKMLDELTPYYQERIRWLPPLQRKIVEFLCACEGTVPVREIARRLFATSPTISSQLQDLREKGYVEANQRGRESLYEVSEPLMRICVEVKDPQRHQPLRLLVDFLRAWYDDRELKDRLGTMAFASESRAYLESAIQRNNAEGNLRKQLLIADFDASLPETLPPKMRAGLLRELGQQPEGALLAMRCMNQGDTDGTFDCLRDAIAQESTAAEKAQLLLLRGDLHLQSGAREKALVDYATVAAMADAPAEKRGLASHNRGVIHGEDGDIRHAITDFTEVIELPGSPIDKVAMALINRGVAYGHTGELQHELDDYAAVVGLVGAPTRQVAMALTNRGIAYGRAGEMRNAINDFTAAIALPDVPSDLAAVASLNRGVARRKSGEMLLAIGDFAAVLELQDVPVTLRAKAHLWRGIACGQTGDELRELDDYTAVISLVGAPTDHVVMAYVNRGVARRRAGHMQYAIDDFTAAIGLTGAPAIQVAKALLNRAISLSEMGERRREVDDYTAVIEMTGAPADHVAMALVNRGSTYGQWGDAQRAIDDFTAVLGMSAASCEQIAMALVGRGVAHEHEGDTQRAIDDFTTAIGLSSIPVDMVAKALFCRGVAHYQARRMQDSQSDFESLLLLPNAPVNTVVDAHLALAELHSTQGRWDEGFQALDAGVERGTKTQPPYYPSAADVVGAIFAAGLAAEGRREKAGAIFAIYRKHNALAVLGEAVVQHIGTVFRTGEPFPSGDNLEGWASAWEKAAEGVDEFRLSIRLLRTGVNFVKSGGQTPSVLLDLTSAERAILRQAFGLPDENAEA
jgi:tetratricopeptide (TPR) repeat protein